MVDDVLSNKLDKLNGGMISLAIFIIRDNERSIGLYLLLCTGDVGMGFILFLFCGC